MPGIYFLYIESSPPQSSGERAELVSPSIKLDQPKNCLSFWYHMRGANVAELKVSAKTQAGATDLWSANGHQGDDWLRAEVELNSSPTSFKVSSMSSSLVSSSMLAVQSSAKVTPGRKHEINGQDFWQLANPFLIYSRLKRKHLIARVCSTEASPDVILCG